MRVGERLVADRRDYRVGSQQLVVGSEQHAFIGRLGRRIQSKPPAPPARLERDAVAVGDALERERLARVEQRGRAPGAAVEVVQHRAAPVALFGRRHGPEELGTKGRIVVGRELQDAARAHAVGQARLRLLAARNRPERSRQAREEYEQQQRQRQRQQQRAPCQPQRRGGRELRVADHRERCAAQPHLERVQGRAPQVLAVEAGGEQQEQRRTHHDHLVACAARLEQLQCRHQQQERGACGKAIERVEPRQHHRDQSERQQRAAGDAGVPGRPARTHQAPDDECQGCDAGPRRQAVRVQQHRAGKGCAHPHERPQWRARAGAVAAHAGGSARPCSASAARQR